MIIEHSMVLCMPYFISQHTYCWPHKYSLRHRYISTVAELNYISQIIQLFRRGKIIILLEDELQIFTALS